MQALVLLEQRCPSVRMPVRPSVTLWYYIKMNKIVMVSSPTKSQKTLVFANIGFIPKFERGHSNEGDL